MQEAKRKIKVLQIIDNINIDAGVSTVVMNFYRYIDREIIQFDFLVCHEGFERGKTYDKEIRSLGGNIYYFGTPLSAKEIIKSTNYTKRFFKKNAFKYDIVHLHTPTIAEFTIKYAKQFGVKEIITHSHSAMTSTNPLKALVNSYLISRIKKYTNHFWACSTEAAEFMFGKKFCETNQVEIVKNAIEPHRFAFDSPKRGEVRENLHLSHKIVLVHVSNFSQIKNLLFMVPIIKKVTEKNKNFCFLFVGNGPMKATVEREIIRSALSDSCIFVGQREDVCSYLQCADAFFLPSLSEGFGVAAVEAQATGLKCLLSNTITREVDAGQVSFIPLDINSWVDKILSLDISTEIQRKEASQNFAQSELNVSNEIVHIQNLYSKIAKI